MSNHTQSFLSLVDAYGRRETISYIKEKVVQNFHKAFIDHRLWTETKDLNYKSRNQGNNIKEILYFFTLPLIDRDNVITHYCYTDGLLKIAEEECDGFFVILTTNQFYKAPLQQELQVQYLRWKSSH